MQQFQELFRTQMSSPSSQDSPQTEQSQDEEQVQEESPAQFTGWNRGVKSQIRTGLGGGPRLGQRRQEQQGRQEQRQELPSLQQSHDATEAQEGEVQGWDADAASQLGSEGLEPALQSHSQHSAQVPMNASGSYNEDGEVRYWDPDEAAQLGSEGLEPAQQPRQRYSDQGGTDTSSDEEGEIESTLDEEDDGEVMINLEEIPAAEDLGHAQGGDSYEPASEPESGEVSESGEPVTPGLGLGAGDVGAAVMNADGSYFAQPVPNGSSSRESPLRVWKGPLDDWLAFGGSKHADIAAASRESTLYLQQVFISGQTAVSGDSENLNQNNQQAQSQFHDQAPEQQQQQHTSQETAYEPPMDITVVDLATSANSLTLADISDADLQHQLRYYHIGRDVNSLPLSTPVRCPTCGTQGHLSYSCPSTPCRNCGVPINRAPSSPSSCASHPTPYTPEATVSTPTPNSANYSKCSTCKSLGHKNTECESLWRTSAWPPERALPPLRVQRFCYECGEGGHLGNDCPSRRPDKAPGTSSWSSRTLAGGIIPACTDEGCDVEDGEESSEDEEEDGFIPLDAEGPGLVRGPDGNISSGGAIKRKRDAQRRAAQAAYDREDDLDDGVFRHRNRNRDGERHVRSRVAQSGTIRIAGVDAAGRMTQQGAPERHPLPPPPPPPLQQQRNGGGGGGGRGGGRGGGGFSIPPRGGRGGGRGGGGRGGRGGRAAKHPFAHGRR